MVTWCRANNLRRWWSNSGEAQSTSPVDPWVSTLWQEVYQDRQLTAQEQILLICVCITKPDPTVKMLKVIHCNYKLHTSLNIIINAGNTCGLVIERQIKSQGVCFAGRAQGDYSVSTSESTCVKWPRLNLPLLTCTVHFLLPPKFLHLLHPAVALHLSSNMFFPLWSQYPEGKTHLQKYANVNIILLHLCYSIFILFLNSLMCKWMQHDSKPSPLQHMSHSEKFHSVVYIWSVLTQDVSIF